MSKLHKTEESLSNYMGPFRHLPGPRQETSVRNWNSQIMLLSQETAAGDFTAAKFIL